MSSPATIYQPLPIAVQNYNFEENPPSFPAGWQNGGAGLNTSYAFSYDATSQYEGLNSFVINASANLAGISQNLGTVVPGEVYQISAALRVDTLHGVAAAELVFLDVAGNRILGPLPGVNYSPAVAANEDTVGTAWVLSANQGTVPVGAVSMQVQLFTPVVGTAEFDVVQVTRLSSAIPYYLSKVPHQYQGAPNFNQFLAMLLQPLVDGGICATSLNEAFDIDAAIGAQLDTLGRILGTPRTLPFTPVGVSALTTSSVTAGPNPVTTNNTNYMDTLTPLTVDVGGSAETVTPFLVTPGVGFSAIFANSHSSGVAVTSAAPSAILGDDDYRVLLKAKILQNQWDGQADSLWDPWQLLFPGGQIFVTDNQNMTCTIFLVGLFSTVVQQMITNGLIVPKPEAVQYTYTFATTPIFGFGNVNPTLVAGFGTGSGAYPGGNWA